MHRLLPLVCLACLTALPSCSLFSRLEARLESVEATTQRLAAQLEGLARILEETRGQLGADTARIAAGMNVLADNTGQVKESTAAILERINFLFLAGGAALLVLLGAGLARRRGGGEGKGGS